jgi:glycosyltransferase involved in cell wall biosynthesis
MSNALRVVFNGADELQDSPWNERGLVMRNSVDPAQLAGEAKEAEGRYQEILGKTRFLFLGRLDVKHKGLDYLMESFSCAARGRDDVVLILAGPDERSDRQALRDLIAANGLEGKILFTGLVTGAEKSSLLNAADVFVLTSRFEGGSNIALLEALWVGLPVVVTPGVGMTEEIVENRLGIVASPGDELTTALGAMMDSDVRQKYVGRGRQVVTDNFVWQKTAACFLQEIEKFLPSELNWTADAGSRS